MERLFAMAIDTCLRHKENSRVPTSYVSSCASK